jgi:transcriptional regulator with XRE-family HTH domain
VTRILKARQDADITQGDVAAAVGRSQIWLSRAERGLAPIDKGVEARILLAIERIKAHKERMRLDRQQALEGLRLPRCATI